MNDLLPADIYTVINKTVLTDKDRDNLITLYTPIIGNLAISLYFTLWRDLNKLEIMSIDLTHHHLIKILKSELVDILKARETLEAVGLIKSYLKKDNINKYVYELYSPLSASEFLNHPILNVVLYKNIGKKEYDLIKREYTAINLKLDGYEEITRKINKVFKSCDMDKVITNERVSLGIKDIDLIDFELVINMLPKGLVNNRVFTKSLKELINNLAFVYNIDSYKMGEIIRTIVEGNGKVNVDELKINVRKYYQFSHSTLPTLVYENESDKCLDGVTKKDKMIAVFESTSPYLFLKFKNKGSEPTGRDLKIVEELIVNVGLNPGVVNVIVDYALRKNNNKLVKAYLEAIAGQMKRNGVVSAKEALETIQSEGKQRVKTKSVSKTKQQPEWFKKDIEKENLNEEESLEMEELLKSFK